MELNLGVTQDFIEGVELIGLQIVDLFDAGIH